MKEIKIFLASSINEFKTERNAIGDFIRRLQDQFVEYDIYFDLFECEFYDNTISTSNRMQLVYNDIAKKSDLFFMLVGKKLGEFTLEEYRETNKILTLEKYVIFYGNEHDDSVLKFMECLKQETSTKIIKTSNLNEIFELLKNAISKNLDYQFTITIDDNKIKVESF